MKKLAKDIQMFREAIKTRDFWHDLKYTIWAPVIFAALVFKYRGDRDIIVLLALVVAPFVLCAWYTLSNGYILFTYGTVRRFKISEIGRVLATRYIQGFLQGEHRRWYTLRSYRVVHLKVGETILVVHHPYRDSIGWITKRSAQNYGQLERFQMMQVGSLPMYYEDMLPLK
jgi:hypothetical protein